MLADPILTVDSDLADPNNSNTANGTISQAQFIDPDAEVRGYIQCTGKISPSDPCDPNDDDQDYYRATLEAGQVVTLTIADFSPQTPDTLDLDLYLTDLTGTILAQSIAFSSKNETVTVPENGEYIIIADAFVGSSNYSLVITPAFSTGPQQPAAASQMSTMSPHFLTVVEPQSTAIPDPVRKRYRERQVASREDRRVLRPRLVTMDDGDLAPAKTGALSPGFLRDRLGIETDAPVDPDYAAKLTLLHHIKITNATARREVLAPYHYPRMHQVAPPPDPSLQWNLGSVDWQSALQEIEDRLPGAQRPLVAVLDSGVLTTHPKIAPVIVDARDFVPAFIDGDAFDAEAEESVDPNDPNGSECFDFHGTHVATIATAPRGGPTLNGRDMVGGAPFADLMMLKLGFSQGDDCRLIVGDIPEAIRYAAGLPNASQTLPPRRADVINLSFGGPAPNPATEAAIEEAIAAGVIVVASAGNDGDGTENGPSWPASFPDVFAVAATDINDLRAPYSSFYPQVEIAAPGGDVRFDLNVDGFADGIIGGVGRLNTAGNGFDPRYSLYQGTSMAAPMAAAGFALMKSIYPQLTSDEAHRLVEEGLLTTDIGAPGRDPETGFGLISYRKMVDVALQLRDDALNLPPGFRIDPPVVDLGNIGNTATIDVTRLGSPSFTIDRVSVAVTGSSASIPDGQPLVTDAEGFGTYEITVDRSGFTPGSYFGEITVHASNGDTKIVPLSFQIPQPSLNAETAPALILLEAFDGNGFTEVDRIVSNGAGESFSLTGVEAGDYRLRITTDMDFDREICDAGELGGTFPGKACDSTAVFTVPDDSESVTLDLILDRLPD
ncbi:S8 family serine peptidase [Parvularcula lutaonensis]|uniref:S8 family serine peptidase n=1 Tax=Parvularcula lutaonensis TaxID=491923 RepID=A0ABV7MCK6_9PROT|nr:S8 family serine peptidase [Parvularcula lutaonensis]GGY50232.1 hypothetical protein GCM10007148_18770 [Parvularcula lutaonensis]